MSDEAHLRKRAGIRIWQAFGGGDKGGVVGSVRGVVVGEGTGNSEGNSELGSGISYQI